MKREVNLDEFKIIGLEQIIENIFEKAYDGSKGSIDYLIINHFEEIRLGLIEKEIFSILEQYKNLLIKDKQNLILKLYQTKITINKFILEKIKITLDDYSKRLISSAASRLYNQYQNYNDSLLELIKKDEELIIVKPKTKTLERKVVNQ